jgi:tetratricopeptide (TPR) repeat protein
MDKTSYSGWRATPLLMVLAGCGPGKVPYTGGEPMYGYYLGDHERAIATAEDTKAADDSNKSDYAVYQLSMGINKLHLGDLAGAEKHWANAAAVVDSGAGALRGVASLALNEKTRYFKGSVFERTALWYYRGLTFLLGGDEESAYTCFRRAIEVDRSSGPGQEGRDNGILWYFMARDLLKRGENESDNLRIALAKAQKHIYPGNNVSDDALRNHNLVILIDTTSGPFWGASGAGNKWLVRDSESVVGWPVVSIDGGPPIPAAQATNWYHQAVTESDGAADTVRDVKVVARTVGKVAGAVVTRGEFAGFDRSGSADSRTWDELPDSTWLVSVQVPPGPHTINVKYRHSAPFTINTAGLGDKQDEKADAFSHADELGGERGYYSSPDWEAAGRRVPSLSSKVWYAKAGVVYYFDRSFAPGEFYPEYEQTIRGVGVDGDSPTFVLTHPHLRTQATLEKQLQVPNSELREYYKERRQ